MVGVAGRPRARASARAGSNRRRADPGHGLCHRRAARDPGRCCTSALAGWRWLAATVGRTRRP